MALRLLRTLGKSAALRSNARSFCILSTEVVTSHTDKWMQDRTILRSEPTKRSYLDISILHGIAILTTLLDKSKKSPMELINEVPPIKVEGRIVACEGSKNPLGHPIEFICLDLDTPAVCKYCGLRYVQDRGGHHH